MVSLLPEVECQVEPLVLAFLRPVKILISLGRTSNDGIAEWFSHNYNWPVHQFHLVDKPNAVIARL